MDISELLKNDTIRLLLALFVQIGLSWPIRFIKSRTERYTYSLLIGTFLQWCVFSYSIIWIHIFGALMFAIVKLIPARCGGPVTFLSMLFLSWYHLNAIIYRYGE